MDARRVDETARGVFVISATPFTEAGVLDLPGVDALVRFYLDAGVRGITILGMMGEAPKLTFQESASFTRHVLESVAGRVPVIVGVSNAGLANLTALADVAMEAGAAGVLVAPVSGLRTDDQVFDYYAAVCEALGPRVPVIYQDYPLSTGVYLSASTYTRLVNAFPQLVMLKAEDCPGLAKITAVRESEAHGVRRTSILVGNGGFYFPQALARGADGVMTGFAFPDMLTEVYERFTGGDRDGAEDLFERYLPVMYYEQQPGYGLAVRKEILRRRGALGSATVRRPGPGLTRVDLEELDRLLARLERRRD